MAAPYPIQSLPNGNILWSDGRETGPMSTPFGQVSTQPQSYTYNQANPPSPQQNAAAEQWARLHSNEGVMPVGYHGETEGGGGGTSGGDPIENLLQAIVDPVSKALQDWNSRLTEFDKNNPFSFDEAQAKASSAERLNPYYDATLNEFMTGIRRSSTRSVEDMTRTIGELNVDASKLSEKERLNTQEAIRSSEEGYAGAGLFFSGKRERATGLEEVQGAQTQEGIQTELGRNLATQSRLNTRTQEDLALQQARTKRLTEAERTTALETDIAKQKKEAEIRRAQEQLAYAGPSPGSGNNFSLQNQLYGLY